MRTGPDPTPADPSGHGPYIQTPGRRHLQSETELHETQLYKSESSNNIYESLILSLRTFLTSLKFV